MARPRKYFFMELQGKIHKGLLKATITDPDGNIFNVVKIHPRKGGVTVTKVG